MKDSIKFLIFFQQKQIHLKAIIKLLNGIVAKWRRPATDNTQSYERVSSKPLRS